MNVAGPYLYGSFIFITDYAVDSKRKKNATNVLLALHLFKYIRSTTLFGICTQGRSVRFHLIMLYIPLK